MFPIRSVRSSMILIKIINPISRTSCPVPSDFGPLAVTGSHPARTSAGGFEATPPAGRSILVGTSLGPDRKSRRSEATGSSWHNLGINSNCRLRQVPLASARAQARRSAAASGVRLVVGRNAARLRPFSRREVVLMVPSQRITSRWR